MNVCLKLKNSREKSPESIAKAVAIKIERLKMTGKKNWSNIFVAKI